MDESHSKKVADAAQASRLKRVVAQPTKRSEKRAVIDKATFTGIREDKRR